MPPKVWTSTFVGSDPVQDPTPIDQPGVFEALVFSDVSDPTQANALAEKVDACARLLGDKNNSPAKSICDILNRNHSTGDAQHVRYYNASDPTPAANKGFSYVKAGEFYYRDSIGNIVKITNSGNVVVATHAPEHQSGGSDVIKLDDLAAPDDNTDLNATISQHGLLPKLGGGTTNFLRADGSWAAPVAGGGGFDHEKVFTATVSGAETFDVTDTMDTNANTPSGYSVRVFVNGNRHQYTSAGGDPGIREFKVPSATTVRVGNLSIGDNVQIDYGV